MTMTHAAIIAGQVYMFSRPAVDLPSAEVWIERADGGRWAVNTQYAFWDGAVNPRAFQALRDSTASADDLLPIAKEIVNEARAYHIARNRAASMAEQQACDAAAQAGKQEREMPEHVRSLFDAYGSADAAWDAGDEGAWARMTAYER